jgi:hypothetical protein
VGNGGNIQRPGRKPVRAVVEVAVERIEGIDMGTTVPSKAIADLLKPYSPEVRKLALATRALVLRVIPKAIEQVDAKAKIIGYGFGSGYKDMICSLMPAKGWVTLGIGWGVELPDPEKLLEGAGKVHRHVKLRSESDVKAPALAVLLKDGIAHWQNKRRSKGTTAKA